MVKTDNERQQALRNKRAVLGQKRREYSLTDAEKIKVDKYIKRMRKGT